MRICWFGIYDPEYSRNRILIDGLLHQGVSVIECKTNSSGIRKYLDLISQLRSLRGQYDILFCAFPVHICIVIAKIFQSKPIVSDAFVSGYDSMVYDRCKYSKWHPYAWLLYLIDDLTIRLSDHVICDSRQHQIFWRKLNKKVSIDVVPVGVHTDEFFPLESSRSQKTFLVQFHGSYIPLQGVGRLLDAVALLQADKRFSFRFIGRGQLYEDTFSAAKERQLPITFLPWLPISELNKCLNEADLILGIFGDTAKTDRVIPNKVYQGMAVKKPVLTKDTPAIREEFSSEQLFLCSNDPEDIAKTIIHIADHYDAAKDLAVEGYKDILKRLTHIEIGSLFLESLKKSL